MPCVRARWPKCAYMISQDADAAPNRSDLKFFMCQTRGQDIVFVDEADRWLFWKEFLVFQGYPMYPQLQSCHAIETSFHKERVGREPAHVIEQSGNSIPLPMIMLALVYVLHHTEACSGPRSRQSSPATSTPDVISTVSMSVPSSSSSSTGSKRRRTLRSALSV